MVLDYYLLKFLFTHNIFTNIHIFLIYHEKNVINSRFSVIA